MAVRIRLKRVGGKNEPSFRVIATDSRSPRDGRFVEYLGWYDPKKTGINFELKADRLAYWTGCGAQVSETVRSLARRAVKAAKTAGTPA